MRKWNSVFANLAISYMSIVLVIVLLLCSTFYIYFSGNYKDELRDRNQLILNNTVQTIETTVLQRAQQIYLDISLNKNVNVRLFADSTYQSNHSKAIDLQELLKSEVISNSDIVQAVHLYYPKNNMLLSSLYGLRLNADQDRSMTYLADWIQGMQRNQTSSYWTPTRFVPQDIYASLSDDGSNALITYAHSYPFQTSGEDSDVIIAVDVKESAIREIIQNMMPSQYEGTFILDRSGSTISDADASKLGQQGGFGDSALKEEAGSDSGTIDQDSHVVSYQVIPSTGWVMYSVVLSSSFYEKSIFVQKLILGICLLVILIGIVLSGILARANSNPIKRLAAKIRGLLDHAPEHGTNEYSLIDTAFVKLKDKVDSLEETLEANSAVIKHNVVQNLLNSCYTLEEWQEEQPFLGFTTEYHHYSCLVLDSSEALGRLDSRNMQYAVYRIINQLETAALPDSRIIAEALPDKKVVVIVCTNEASGELLEQISQFVISEGKEQFQLDVQISWGCWVPEMTDVHRSYSEAQTKMKYAYFLPDTAILNDRRLLDRENSMEEIPQAIVAKFRDKLQARQPQELEMAVEQMVLLMQEGMYSADHCRFILGNIVFLYSDYLKSVQYKHPEQDNRELHNQFVQLRSIRSFQQWLISSASGLITYLEKRNSERAVSSIEVVKQYIQDNLSGDLSLDAVSAQVFLSSKYLSKLFKEEIGMNYTEYVTSQRMERAKELIEMNNMTVEQIANTVGYGTAAYFIKKFKEMHGCTPGNYLRNSAKEA
ncbi:AraC-like DNA-binding protein [Paenibacillus cellulosilyticus]|uniref:AraC-like DNA-binding protein n=1 Tax=Paenibacillus cellulosilyticus TaxID=375489 RepID=A0A2V2YT43_9BACL|nr:helix-turn-helix domain-containing protein [Paenibacillus cellulosilyticus]PWW02429.1 AraC-like DNA-binding protein [Paenibacillus cellulosilyticus]QKS47140.1 AraC family transcriptional regulator [Paenibacillus cellulosilyticus]